jgi:L-rhamnose mutarotase
MCKQMKTTRHCLAIDLKDDPQLIEEYERWHQPENGWPEIQHSIVSAGIINMEIFRTGNRLFMIMETNENFDLKRKAEMDAANPKVQEWEALMWKFQQSLPWAADGEKWVAMNKIFELQRIR